MAALGAALRAGSMPPSYVIHKRAMHVSPLAVVAVLVLGAAGCHSSSAGGRPRDGGSDGSSDLTEKLGPPDADCPADAMGGTGVCPVNFCGQVKSVAALAAGEAAGGGADSICTPPDICVPSGPTASGDALQLACVSPLAGSVGFGGACATGGAAGTPCASDALCIEVATASGQPFCSALCRADADCPADAYCLERRSDMLPDGSYANLGFCIPADKLGQTPCTREADCAATEGCLSYGPRTTLFTCQPAAGNKAVGEACSGGAQCRSGDCLDRDGHVGAGQSRAFCAAVCAKNSDCGADQRCLRTVFNNNGTPSEPRDDVVVGYCRTLFVPTAAAGCQNDGDCTARADGSDTCQTTYGLCYKAAAAIGAPCAGDAACAVGATCATGPRFPGGACVAAGCDPAATAAPDACPGTNSVCTQRASDQPVHVCYEACVLAGDCSRFSNGYTCETPQAGQPPFCISGGGP
jgi:hypothetical protein